jgi:hypothetical protein
MRRKLLGMKRNLITFAIVVAGVATLIFAPPIIAAMNAERQYSAVGDWSFAEKCETATRAKEAWLTTAFTGKAQGWAEAADRYCPYANR